MKKIKSITLEKNASVLRKIKPSSVKTSGFPIKDFGNDRRRGRHPYVVLLPSLLSFLNGSIRNLNYLKTRISGCLIKALRHDRRGECLAKFRE